MCTCQLPYTTNGQYHKCCKTDRDGDLLLRFINVLRMASRTCLPGRHASSSPVAMQRDTCCTAAIHEQHRGTTYPAKAINRRVGDRKDERVMKCFCNRTSHRPGNPVQLDGAESHPVLARADHSIFATSETTNVSHGYCDRWHIIKTTNSNNRPVRMSSSALCTEHHNEYVLLRITSKNTNPTQ